jgi:hypothetical protein
MELTMPAEAEELELVPEATLGAGGRVDSRVLIGIPTAQPVTLQDVDERSAETLALLGEADYYALAFRCTLVEYGDDRMLSARFQVTLPEGAATAWALDPVLESRPVHVVQKAGSPSVSVKVPFGLSATLGFDASRSTEFDVDDWWLKAYGVSQRTPQWSFRRRPSRTIGGDHLLRLVARVASGTAFTATCSFSAMVASGPISSVLVRARRKDNALADPYAIDVRAASRVGQ